VFSYSLSWVSERSRLQGDRAWLVEESHIQSPSWGPPAINHVFLHLKGEGPTNCKVDDAAKDQLGFVGKALAKQGMDASRVMKKPHAHCAAVAFCSGSSEKGTTQGKKTIKVQLKS